MNRSSMCARAGLVALSVLMGACGKTEQAAAPKREAHRHGAAIFEREKTPGRFVGVPSPDPIVVRPYDPNVAGAHVVIWAYGHKATGIRIDDPAVKVQPDCPPDTNVCTWEVPAGLLKADEKTRKIKYTITGKHDDNTDLDPNDPFIEVDR